MPRLLLLWTFLIAMGFVFSPSAYGQMQSQARSPGQTQTQTQVQSEQEKEVYKSKQALWVAHILRDRSAINLKELSLDVDKLPVYLVPQGENFRPMVKLKLKYNKPGWKLFLSDKDPVKATGVEGEYVVYAYLRSRISTLFITAVGPNNERVSETFYMFAPEAREFKMVSLFDSMFFTLGHSYMIYRQTSFGTFVSQALLVGAKYFTPEKGYRLGYFGEANLTLFTYTSSPIKENPQFFEARGGLSYLVNFTKNPKLRSRLTLGAGTINLFSLGAPFGFSGLYGLNLGLRTEFYKSAKRSFGAEVYITPYDFSDPLSERTAKFSFDITDNLNNLRRIQYGLSYSSHKFSESIENINADQFNAYVSLSF